MFVATVGRRWRCEGGGQTPVLCPVTQNLTRVCPPLHVSSAANHGTHVRRSPFPDCFKGSGSFPLSMLGVIKLFLFGRAEKQNVDSPPFSAFSTALRFSLLPSSPFAPPFPSPPQSICIMSICQTASVCSN